MKGVTTNTLEQTQDSQVEKHFKMKGATTDYADYIRYYVVEKHLKLKKQNI